MPEQIRLVVADDHAIVREGLCRLLAAHPNLTVLAEAGNGREAVALAASLNPDIVLMDISMPEVNGIQATQQIKAVCPDVSILILTAHEDINLMHMAMSAGANGYLLKNSDKEMLAGAILEVMETGTYVPSHMQDSAEEDSEAANHQNLTRREKEIFGMVAQGLKNREISDKLCISVKTVEKHRANLMKKLGLHSVAELVSYALRTGLLMPEPSE